MKKHIKIQKKKLKNFDPKLKEECGVFGISSAKDAAAAASLALLIPNTPHSSFNLGSKFFNFFF